MLKITGTALAGLGGGAGAVAGAAGAVGAVLGPGGVVTGLMPIVGTLGLLGEDVINNMRGSRNLTLLNVTLVQSMPRLTCCGLHSLKQSGRQRLGCESNSRNSRPWSLVTESVSHQ